MTPDAFDSFPLSVCIKANQSHKAFKRREKDATSRTHPVRCWARVHLFQLASTFASVDTQHTLKFSTQMVWDMVVQRTTELTRRAELSKACSRRGVDVQTKKRGAVVIPKRTIIATEVEM